MKSSLLCLTEGLNRLALSTAVEPLLRYLALLEKWNQAYNLTAVTDFEAMITHHVLDSLAIAPWIRGERLLDIGTGAGFPGIPLALNNPALQVVLLDSNGKKIRFLEEVKRTLSIKNIEIIQSRAECYQAKHCFDTLTSRAFSSLDQLLIWTQSLVRPGGIWLAMKGRYPESELASIRLPYQVHSYTVPHLVGERCCVIIENV